MIKSIMTAGIFLFLVIGSTDDARLRRLALENQGCYNSEQPGHERSRMLDYEGS